MLPDSSSVATIDVPSEAPAGQTGESSPPPWALYYLLNFERALSWLAERYDEIVRAAAVKISHRLAHVAA